MKLLLDTHVLLWWLDDPNLLTEESRDAIADPDNEVFVSAVVIWEIAIKRGLGKLTAPSGEKRQVRTAGWLSVNDGQSLLNAAISGLGIAYLPSYLYADSLKQGLIEDAIPDLPMETQGIYAVYPPGRFTQPKVRAFIDFLVHSFAEKGPSDW